MKRGDGFRVTGGLAMCAAALGLAGTAAGAAQWADRNEYDLVLNIRAEAAAQKRVALLDQWKAKYPKSQFQQERLELYLAAWQSLSDSSRMLAVAREMLESGDSLVGLYWCTLLVPEAKEATPEVLGAGEKAARQLLAGLDKYFPAGAAGREAAELLAHRALGWIQWQRGDYPAAEAEFTKCLQQDAKRAEISAWLGTVLALDKQPANQVPALWHLARAASYRGAGALPDGQRRQLTATLERMYTTYHGETAGLDQLRMTAAGAAFPTAGFDIESATAIALRKQDEELARTNPQLAAWLRLRRRLEAPDGEAYFTASLKNTPLPMRLKGTLLRGTPEKKPNELVLGVGDAAAEEVILKLDSAFSHAAEAGTVLEFEGTMEGFTKAPFTITVSGSTEKVEGWPGRGK